MNMSIFHIINNIPIEILPCLINLAFFLLIQSIAKVSSIRTFENTNFTQLKIFTSTFEVDAFYS